MPSKSKFPTAPRSARSPRIRVQTTFTKPSLTEQSHASACDVNQIMARFLKGTPITHVNHNQPTYGDAPSLDFREAMDIIQNAETQFDALPSAIRKRFDNSPHQFLQFMENPENVSEAIEMGLAVSTAPPVPDPIPEPDKPSEGE